MAPWTPGMPWPSGTPGGASTSAWGGYVRLWLRAALAGGRAWHLGPHDADRLDAGNVMSGVGVAVQLGGERLWVDITCDVMDLEVQGGASAGQGIFTKVEAATLSVTLADPEGHYDPLTRTGPYVYGGRSKLVPGTPVELFAEVVDGDDGTWQRHLIFSGTADSWGEEWTPNPRERQAKLLATDATKVWARYDRPEQPPAGEGDTVAERIHRIVTFFGWPGTVEDPPGGSTRTLQATTLAQPGWELLNRATDDELGVIFLTPDGTLRWLNRETWPVVADPRLGLGCEDLAVDGLELHDVLLEATPGNLDLQMRNTVHASRSGGTEQVASSTSSVQRYGPYEYGRTDLGLADDAQVAQWATKVVELYAFPQVGIADVVFRPGADPASWQVWDPVLDWRLFTDILRVRWQPPDLPPEHLLDGELRVVGYRHAISRQAWEVTWQLIAARPMFYSGAIFTMGPHANDRLDAALVMG